ncbi:hypothetical protein [Streptomyces sp. NPDC051554]|uniref:hypothetical protein n=1 Tax=Streptomyces sp. NPDC051554 TaxID=3365656 RepID=UPI0037ADF916
MTTYTPVGDSIALCLHPNQTSTRRPSPPRRVRERRKAGPRRWTLRTFTVPGRPVLDVACPDCSARAVYISDAGTVLMGPWLVSTEDVHDEALRQYTEAAAALKANLKRMVGALPDRHPIAAGLEKASAELGRPLYFHRRPARLVPAPMTAAGCYQASFGRVHVRPACRCQR